MKYLFALLTFLLFFSGVSPSLFPPQEFRFALLIGNADYEGTSRLDNPINDIRRLSPLFKKYGFDVTQIENANQEIMGKVIDDFGKKITQTRQNNPQAQITTLFYYSGHGLSHEGRNYLIPVKTEIPNPESLQYRAKSLEEITSLFSSSDVRLLFFDACRNEPPTRSWWRDLPTVSKNQGLTSPKVEESTPRLNSELNGTCIGYATALGKRALDGNISISPYAEAFEKELIENPSLPLSKLLINIGKHVGKTTQYAQDPWQSSTRTVGRFRFDITSSQIAKEEISSSIKVQENNKKDLKDLPTIKTLPNGIKLLLVEGGSFMMGSNEEGRSEKPVHEVTLDNYYIAETEVTNAQYAAFLNKYGSNEVKTGRYKGQKMIEESQYNEGYNWGINKIKNQWKPQKGYENHPVINVTWYGANEFCKYYGGFLPSEAQWEYAARGGKQSNNYKYAGSNNFDEIAWYYDNSDEKGSDDKDYGTHQVGTKKPNELGLYDMSGNVVEWCQDWYDEEYYEENNDFKNPINSTRGIERVLRGSSWSGDITNSTYRMGFTPTDSGVGVGFRICLFDIIPALPITKNLNGIKLIKVEGGSFMMGSNEERRDEKLHRVMLDDYYIGETEVTNAQYAAFLNEYGSDEIKTGEYKGQKMIHYEYKYKWGLNNNNNQRKPQKGYENHPVIYVTWYGANEFCKYYGGFLPSEAQWEYAARGGNKSKNYKYAGSNNFDEVSWYDDKEIFDNNYYVTHQVGTKYPNELGLFDMNGNVSEWCQDWYDEKYYEESYNLMNPINLLENYNRVLRGGSRKDIFRAAQRSSFMPTIANDLIGFRICMPSI